MDPTNPTSNVNEIVTSLESNTSKPVPTGAVVPQTQIKTKLSMKNVPTKLSDKNSEGWLCDAEVILKMWNLDITEENEITKLFARGNEPIATPTTRKLNALSKRYPGCGKAVVKALVEYSEKHPGDGKGRVKISHNVIDEASQEFLSNGVSFCLGNCGDLEADQNDKLADEGKLKATLMAQFGNCVAKSCRDLKADVLSGRYPLTTAQLRQKLEFAASEVEEVFSSLTDGRLVSPLSQILPFTPINGRDVQKSRWGSKLSWEEYAQKSLAYPFDGEEENLGGFRFPAPNKKKARYGDFNPTYGSTHIGPNTSGVLGLCDSMPSRSQEPSSDFEYESLEQEGVAEGGSEEYQGSGVYVDNGGIDDDRCDALDRMMLRYS